MGERLFRAISPFLQGLAMMMLLTIFFLFPVSSQFLEVLTNLGRSLFSAVLVFGYIRDASGRIVIPAGFQRSSRRRVAWQQARGCRARSCLIPFAYRRRMRYLVEGSG